MRKITLILPALFCGSIIFQSYSFTSASISQEASVNLVAEENALIAITYGENKSFVITNNMDKSIRIKSIKIQKEAKIVNDLPITLLPGASKEFLIEGDSQLLFGIQMEISIESENGNMKITSVLPQFTLEQEETDAEKEKVNEEKVDEDIFETDSKEDNKKKENEEPALQGNNANQNDEQVNEETIEEDESEEAARSEQPKLDSESEPSSEATETEKNDEPTE